MESSYERMSSKGRKEESVVSRVSSLNNFEVALKKNKVSAGKSNEKLNESFGSHTSKTSTSVV
jgi:hypothetical protein